MTVDQAFVHLEKRKAEGYRPEIMPLAFGRARIILTDGRNVSHGW